jgi:hypothetical protein
MFFFENWGGESQCVPHQDCPILGDILCDHQGAVVFLFLSFFTRGGKGLYQGESSCWVLSGKSPILVGLQFYRPVGAIP